MQTPLKGTFSIMDIIIDTGVWSVNPQGPLLCDLVIVCTTTIFLAATNHNEVDIVETFRVVTAPDFHFFCTIWAQVSSLAPFLSSTRTRVLVSQWEAPGCKFVA